LRLGDAFALALEHHFAFELHEAGENGQNELSGRHFVSTLSPPRLRIRTAAPPSCSASNSSTIAYGPAVLRASLSTLQTTSVSPPRR
jgi:hypothetical protein